MMKQKRFCSFIGGTSLGIDSNETNRDTVNGDTGNRRILTICLRRKRSFSRIRASLLVALPKPTSRTRDLLFLRNSSSSNGSCGDLLLSILLADEGNS
jgi:hypothetical protein